MFLIIFLSYPLDFESREALVAANIANIITNKIRGTMTGTNNVTDAVYKRKRKDFILQYRRKKSTYEKGSLLDSKSATCLLLYY
jgi:hypothetical protein